MIALDVLGVIALILVGLAVLCFVIAPLFAPFFSISTRLCEWIWELVE